MTALLLDTHAFLWWIADHPSLSARARTAIADDDNQVAVSVASVWEIAIKASIGRLAVPEPLGQFVAEQLARNRFDLLPITVGHAVRVRDLPFHHRDPFDRLLFAQALEDGRTLVSVEGALARRYGVRSLW